MSPGMSVVILVEDDSAVREILVHTLGHAGVRVLDADCPNKALLLVSSTPECMAVVTDINLHARMDGFDVAERALEMNSDLAIVYISGHYEHWLRRTMKSWERSLTKPFEPSELVEVLRELENSTDRLQA
jgi:CheY-like chemotaxis protein